MARLLVLEPPSSTFVDEELAGLEPECVRRPDESLKDYVRRMIEFVKDDLKDREAFIRPHNIARVQYLAGLRLNFGKEPSFDYVLALTRK